MFKKAGILTWHYYSNFGSALQAFALQETLKKVGVKPKIINFRNLKFGKINRYKRFVRYVLGKFCGKKFYIPYIQFQKDFFNETALTQDIEKAKKMCKKFDVVVCGSDQIWAPNAFNSLYMADFKSTKTKKISYAASVGLNDIPKDKADIYKNLLLDFSAISVREDAGKQLLKDKCNIDSTVVLDPTLMLSASKYQKLEKKAPSEPKKPYVFCYFLNKDHQYRPQVEAYAKDKGLIVCGISACEKDKEWMTVLQKIGPGEFLHLVANSQKVITDSYHGTIFSLLYHKDFVTLERFSADDPICQNSRIYQLRDMFGLNERILPAQAQITDTKYDYKVFEQKLSEERKKSIEFLKGALLC